MTLILTVCRIKFRQQFTLQLKKKKISNQQQKSEHRCGQLVMYCIYFTVFFVTFIFSHFKWIFMKL